MRWIQPPVTPTPDGVDLSGKTIIVTGGNTGIGYETARQFLALRASKVILAVRTPTKGEEARDQLLLDSEVQKNNPEAEIKIMKVDMANYKNVIGFSDNVKKEVSELHVLLLNAGIGQLNYETCDTGHEKVTQVNYISNVLLTLELLPLLEATAAKSGSPTRISWVGSRQHEQRSLVRKQPLLPEESVLERFDDESKYLGFSHYSNTKVLCVMFLTELAHRVPRDKVIINTMCPGMVNTRMSDVLPFYFLGL
jgi:NAD(P)-dependent dehydrogenase (short-subunit alcohol dehydrogenase family)